MKKRKDGRYQRQIVVGAKDTGRVDENGKPVKTKERVYVYGNTQKEVNEAYAQLKIQMGKGIDIQAANDCFSLWADRFIKKKEAQQLSASYIVQVKNDRNHLAKLDNIPLSKITVADVQDIIDKLSAWHDGKKPLAKRSLRSVKVTARQIFEIAIESRVIDYNPANYVVIPEKAAQKQREALTNEQQQWIVNPLFVKSMGAMVPHRACRAAMIMMYAGLRRGELLALTWADVDFKNSCIHVQKTVEFDGGQPKNKTVTKTKAGMRSVDIPDILKKYLLAEHKTDTCLYVMHTSSGRQFTESGWRRLWESYMATLNITYGYADDPRVASVNHPKKLLIKIQTFTPHQLRHTFCTLMYLAGVDILDARDQMGHSDIKTTLQIYTHLDTIHKRKSIKKLNKYLELSVGCQPNKKQTC